jgi:hypothetical protein
MSRRGERGSHTVLALVSHAMVAHEHQQRIVWESFDGFLQDLIHELESFAHERVMSMKGVANVINPKEVGDENVPRGPWTASVCRIELPEMVEDPVIDCVYVTSIKRIEWKGMLELIWEEQLPGVVPEKGEALAIRSPLLNQRIF